MSENYYAGARSKYWGGLVAAIATAVFAGISSEVKAEDNINPADYDPSDAVEIQASAKLSKLKVD